MLIQDYYVRLVTCNVLALFYQPSRTPMAMTVVIKLLYLKFTDEGAFLYFSCDANIHSAVF